ncbi:unnamed protein product [Orchesella dallaii]|uniref:Hepcidin n=1 Tax=Orchesella dallaii TaxID=48710 RepID=A0ABP1Q3B1_9HEXA
MKLLLPTILAMLCIVASIDVVVSASVAPMGGHQLAEASRRVVHVAVPNNQDEDTKMAISEQNVEKELDAFDRAEGDQAVVAAKRNCCTCDGGHDCCGSICLGRK